MIVMIDFDVRLFLLYVLLYYLWNLFIFVGVNINWYIYIYKYIHINIYIYIYIYIWNFFWIVQFYLCVIVFLLKTIFFCLKNFCNHIVDFFCVGNRTMKSVIEQWSLSKYSGAPNQVMTKLIKLSIQNKSLTYLERIIKLP